MRHWGRTIPIVIAISLLGAVGWGGRRISSFSRPAPPKQIPVDLLDTATVSEGEFLITVAAPGRLQAHRTIVVMSPDFMGKVTFVAQDGAPVKQGDVLFRFDETDFRRDLRDKEIAYENARAETLKTDRDRDLESKNAQGQVEKFQEELRILKESNATRIRLAESRLSFNEAGLNREEKELEQRRRQAEERLIPLIDLELSEAAVRKRQFDVEQARKELEAVREKATAAEKQKQTALDNALFVAQIAARKAGDEGGAARLKAENLRSQLDRARQQLDWCTLRAPSDGMLILSQNWQMSEDTRRVTRVGDQMRPRSQLAEIPDLSRMQVLCQVPERHIGSVRVGQEALITLEERPDAPYHARVARLGSAAEEITSWDNSQLAPGTRIFNVVLDLVERDPEHLMTGMTAAVEIITRRLPRAVYLRKECVFDEGEHHIVYARQDKAFRAIRVTPGAENARFVQIKDGLRPGQSVARQRPFIETEVGS